jgi:3'-phosphoadenosine 5'-phosphosulfate (PAPS) 3'-phosphatase
MIELLSTCIDAALHACAIIRCVQQEDKSLEVTYKEEWNPRSALTRADVDAQKLIINSLRTYWERKGEHLNVVGEEEEIEQEIPDSSSTVTVATLRGNLLGQEESSKAFFSPLNEEQAPKPLVFDSLSQVTVYVDPLDGTREFVDGRYENVTCLIGIAVDGKPVAGAIGIPFASSTPSSDITTSTSEVNVVYGLVGCGIGYFTGTYDCCQKSISLHTITGQPGIPIPTTTDASAGLTQTACLDDSSVIFMTGDSFDNSPMLSTMLSVARDTVADEIVSIQHTIIGGAGKKMLLCAYASCDASIPKFSFKKQSTYLWDTCAPEAILCAVGGKVTDIFGSPLIYNGCHSKEINRKTVTLRNSLGVIASSLHGRKYHDAICQTLSSSKEIAPNHLM